MNTASRMESNGDVDKIHISEATAKQLMKTGDFLIEERGLIDVKGKGLMRTFWLTGASKDNHIVNDILHTIKSGWYAEQQHQYLISNHKAEFQLIAKQKNVLIVYKSSVVQKMIKNTIEKGNFTVFETKNPNDILPMITEHNIDIVLFQTSFGSGIANTVLETTVYKGGFRGLVLFISATYNELNFSTWSLVMPFDLEQFKHIITMITINPTIALSNKNYKSLELTSLSSSITASPPSTTSRRYYSLK